MLLFLVLIFSLDWRVQAQLGDFSIQQIGNEFFSGNPIFSFSAPNATQEDYPLGLYAMTDFGIGFSDPYLVANINFPPPSSLTIDTRNFTYFTGEDGVRFYVQNPLNETSELPRSSMQIVGLFFPFTVFPTPCDFHYRFPDEYTFICDRSIDVKFFFDFSPFDWLPTGIVGFYIQAFCSDEDFSDPGLSLLPTNACGDPIIKRLAADDETLSGELVFENLENGQPYQFVVIPLFVDLSLNWSGVPGFNYGPVTPGSSTVHVFKHMEIVVFLEKNDFEGKLFQLTPDYQPNVSHYAAQIDVIPYAIRIALSRPENAPRVLAINCLDPEEDFNDCSFDFDGNPYIQLSSDISPRMNLTVIALSEDGSDNTTYYIALNFNALVDDFTEEPDVTNSPKSNPNKSPKGDTTTAERNVIYYSVAIVVVVVILSLVVCSYKYFKKRKTRDNQLSMQLLRDEATEI